MTTAPLRRGLHHPQGVTVNIAPWQLDHIAALWDEHRKPLGFRSFHLGKAGSKPRACRRLAIILDKNHISLATLEAEMVVALVYLQQHGLERGKQVTGSELNARLTFWRFIDPPDNLRALSNLALGRTPDIEAADHERRQGKAQAIKQFRSQVDAFINLLVLRCPEPDQLRRAFTIVTDAMADAESEFS